MVARSALIYVFALLAWSHIGTAQGTKFDDRMSRLVEAQVTSRFSSVVNTLLVEDRRPEWSAVIQVTLHRRASEAELTEVANLIRSKFQPTRSVLIFYTLPGMRYADGAWALTNFTPSLDLKIMGLTDDQEAGLRALPQPAGAKIVGVWFTTMPTLLNGRLTIYTLGGKAFYEWVYVDGSANRGPLTVKKIGNQSRYDVNNADKEHYLVEPDGTIHVGDKTGVYVSVKQ